MSETTSSLDTVALSIPITLAPPLTAAPPSRTAAARERLVSLDVMRGFAVIGMIVVNTLATSKDTYGFAPDFAFLSHSPWAGFTFADFVFPAFIFMAGFSVAVSLRRPSRFDWNIVRRVGTRTFALLALGFLLTNIDWFGQMDHGDWRLLGVLQRIGVCYCATVIVFVTCGPKVRVVLSLLALLAYWPLAQIPVPHEATNLFAPGANFVSYIDRVVLGSHAFATGPHGYDPEGLLSTLPAIAQCVLGAVAGAWFLNNREMPSAPLKLAVAGAVSLGLGLAWSPFFPVIKNIWSSSFVLVSTGLALLLFSLCYWALDRKRFRFSGVTVFEAFGLNALLAYILQGVAQLLPAGDDMHALGAASQKMEGSVLVANLPVVAFLVILWMPLEFMRRRRWIVKL
jgi:predicted acyltransferase